MPLFCILFFKLLNSKMAEFVIFSIDNDSELCFDNGLMNEFLY